jgi:uncharacterized protein YjbI with pentapeptide repeats
MDKVKERWADKEFVASIQPQLIRVFENKANVDALDVSGITVGLEGPLRYLWDRNFAKAYLDNVDFSFGHISASFLECRLDKVDFARTVFDTCYLKKAKFIDCIFDRSTLNITGDDAIFIHCTFRYAKLSGREPYSGSGGVRMTFSDCLFAETVFRNQILRASKFSNCDFTGARFERCDMRGVKFMSTHPHLSQLSDCETSGIKLDGKPLFSKA